MVRTLSPTSLFAYTHGMMSPVAQLALDSLPSGLEATTVCPERFQPIGTLSVQDDVSIAIKDFYDPIEDIVVCETLQPWGNSLFNKKNPIESLYRSVFHRGKNEAENVRLGLRFLRRLLRYDRSELRAVMDHLPIELQEGIRYQSQPTVLWSFMSVRTLSSLSLNDQKIVLRGLSHLWSLDETVPETDEGLEDYLYFGMWIDGILHESIAKWAQNPEQAMELYIAARAMIDSTPEFKEFVSEQGFEWPESNPYFGFSKNIASEVIGMVQGALANRHIAADLRDALAFEGLRLEKCRIIHAHGHGLFMPQHPITRALARDAGLSVFRYKESIASRESSVKFTPSVSVEDDPYDYLNDYFGGD